MISPWGDVVATCDHEAAIVIADVDLNKVNQMGGGGGEMIRLSSVQCV